MTVGQQTEKNLTKFERHLIATVFSVLKIIIHFVF